MGWCGLCCFWKSESLQEDRAIICDASPSHANSEKAVAALENSSDGPSPAIDSAAEEPLLNQSCEPLATPRAPLRRSLTSITPPETPKLPPTKRLKGDVLYMNYPMLIEEDSIEYIQRNKLMVILKGLQGSGKSTVANYLQKVYENAVVCSADSYFMVDGEYMFDAEKLKDAHEASKEKAREAAKRNCPVIVIDNTNIRHWEYQIYIQMSREYHYVAVIIEPQTPWCFNAEELACKNSHGVNANIIAKKIKLYQQPTPIYYGWFLNVPDSQMITKIARQWLERSLIEVEDFFNDFLQFSGLESVEDMLTYFSRESDILHLTTKFTGRGKAEGAMEYINNPVAQLALGRCYPINVIGYVITPQTFGARIQLTEKQLQLWGQNDDESPSENTKSGGEGGYRNQKSSKQASYSEIVNNEDIEIGVEHCEPRVLIISQDLGESRFCPTSGKGSRAHLTIGCSQGVQPVTTGFDMIDIVSCEQKSNDTLATYNISGAVLKFYGKGRWVIYPDTKAVAMSLFSAFY